MTTVAGSSLCWCATLPTDLLVPPNQWRPVSVLAPGSHYSMSMSCIGDDSMKSINSVELEDSQLKYCLFRRFFRSLHIDICIFSRLHFHTLLQKVAAAIPSHTRPFCPTHCQPLGPSRYK